MKKLSKKLLTVLMALALVVAVATVAALAADPEIGNPAAIKVDGVTGGGTEESPWVVHNGKEFMDLLLAIENDEGFLNGPMVYIQLKGNVDTTQYEDENYENDKYGEIADLPLIYAAAQIELVNNATLTVKNYLLPYFGLRLTGEGTIKTTSSSHHYAIWAYDELQLVDCKLNLDDDKVWMNYPDDDGEDDPTPTQIGFECTIIDSEITSSNMEVFQLAHFSTLTMESGSITSTAAAQNKSLGGVITLENDGTNYEGKNAADSTVTINGGTITTNNVAVYVNNDDGTAATKCFTMNGGEIKLSSDAQLPAVVLGNCAGEMTNGTITGGGKAENYSVVLNGMTAYAEEPGTGDPLPVNFTMTGGKIEATNEKGNAISSAQGSKVTVKGGNLVGKSTGAYCAAGSELTIGEGSTISGKYGVSNMNGTVSITGGTINATEYGVYAAKAEEDETTGGKVTISGGTINSDKVGVTVSDDQEVTVSGNANIQSTGSAATVFGNAKLNVQGGTLHSVNGQGISTNGSQSKQVTINVTGGEISSDNSVGVYLPAGTMTVDGKDTSITGKAGIVQFGGKLNVKGGKIEATGTGTVEVGSSGTPVPAAAITTNKQSGYDDSLKALIEGGEFVAPDGTDSVVYTETGEKETENVTNTTFDVKGGFFSSPVDEAYLDSSLNVELESNDKDTPFSYYGSMQDAQTASNELGGEPVPLESSKDKAQIVTSGFLTNADNDFLNSLAKDAKGEAWSKPVIDCAPNTFYVTFKAAPDDAKTPATYTVVFEDAAGHKYTESVTDVGLGGIVYFTPSKQGSSDNIPAENYHGKYTVTLHKGEATGEAVGMATIEVYKVTYKTGDGVDPYADVTVYTDKTRLDAALNDRPAGFKLSASVNYWGRSESKTGDYAYTVTYYGKHVNPGSSDHECPGDVFPDMNLDGFYHEAMDFMIKNGYIKGYPDGYLRPNNITTRAETLKILACNAGVTKKDETVWYKNYIQWAVDHGYSDGKRPDDPIQREEIVTILWRMAGEPKSTQSLASFKDAGEVNDWARTAMAWAVEKGIMAGRGSTQLAPKGVATRAEVACFIYRFLNLEK